MVAVPSNTLSTPRCFASRNRKGNDMKTAEEWIQAYDQDRLGDTERKLSFRSGDLVCAIQLDAMKEGMIRQKVIDAEIARLAAPSFTIAENIELAILNNTAAEQLTKKDL